MTTTDAESAIYVDDTTAEVKAKIKKAFCVPVRWKVTRF